MNKHLTLFLILNHPPSSLVTRQGQADRDTVVDSDHNKVSIGEFPGGVLA